MRFLGSELFEPRLRVLNDALPQRRPCFFDHERLARLFHSQRLAGLFHHRCRQGINDRLAHQADGGFKALRLGAGPPAHRHRRFLAHALVFRCRNNRLRRGFHNRQRNESRLGLRRFDLARRPARERRNARQLHHQPTPSMRNHRQRNQTPRERLDAAPDLLDDMQPRIAQRRLRTHQQRRHRAQSEAHPVQHRQTDRHDAGPHGTAGPRRQAAVVRRVQPRQNARGDQHGHESANANQPLGPGAKVRQAAPQQHRAAQRKARRQQMRSPAEGEKHHIRRQRPAPADQIGDSKIGASEGDRRIHRRIGAKRQEQIQRNGDTRDKADFPARQSGKHGRTRHGEVPFSTNVARSLTRSLPAHNAAHAATLGEAAGADH